MKKSTSFTIRKIIQSDRPWIKQFIRKSWGDETVIVHSQVFTPADLPGLIAEGSRQRPVGLLTYYIQDATCEIITLNSLREGVGVGSSLLQALQDLARSSGCGRIALTTTNDNLNAIGFYQKHGYRLTALRREAVRQARIIKPSIPEFSREGIPIRDELDLEFVL